MEIVLIKSVFGLVLAVALGQSQCESYEYTMVAKSLY